MSAVRKGCFVFKQNTTKQTKNTQELPEVLGCPYLQSGVQFWSVMITRTGLSQMQSASEFA